MRRLHLLLFLIFGILGESVCGQIVEEAKAMDFWTSRPKSSVDPLVNRELPKEFRVIELDFPSIQEYLQKAPNEVFFTQLFPQKTIPLTIPMPDGSLHVFHLYRSDIMASELQRKYPDIQTFAGSSPNLPGASLRMDIGANGLHVIVISPGQMIYIDPIPASEGYMSYFKRDMKRSVRFAEHLVEARHRPRRNTGIRIANGSELRTYRLALAATGEYTQYFGGTVLGALSGMVTTINRVNAIYEGELAIRLVLVGNNDKIIYLDGTSDPYSNNNPVALSTQNQTTLDQVIGTAYYDIGHVFSTGGGGLANLASVCDPDDKAKGVTGIPMPTGDPFDVDYVSHEIGHQFGANHTFNGVREFCGGGNRNGASAFEPGSGSTIMGYAGLCGPIDDLQSNSDAYFHTHSYQQIVLNISAGMASTCATVIATGNTPPVVGTAINGDTIPISTPFELEGLGNDPDGDPLTYCWEQYDKGMEGSPSAPIGSAPSFRSWSPTFSPVRIFPRLEAILDGGNIRGEVLPTYSRTLTFRLTVRDQRIHGGGVNFTTTSLEVTAQAGPFVVTKPNLDPAIWKPGDSVAVTWEVANTDQAPVDCKGVDIFLSVDGGYTYPDSLILAKNTANDGSHQVKVPFVATESARVKIKAADNVFFDISNENFSILDNTGTEDDLVSSMVKVYPNPFKNGFWLEIPLDGRVSVDLIDIQGRVVYQNALFFTPHERKKISLEDMPKGLYYYRIVGENEVFSGKVLKEN